MMKQSVRVGSVEVFITPGEAEDGSFVASARGKHADQTFGADDWTDPRVRLGASLWPPAELLVKACGPTVVEVDEKLRLGDAVRR